MSRLSIEISPKEHQHIKALAAVEGQSIKEFVMGKLFSGDIAQEQSWQELQDFLSNRVEEAQSGKLSSKSISQIMGEEIHAAKQ
ncbi:MAG: hypothetical protein ACJA01_002697 [Saprospiraceae bacterium]|jgi:hypothetical protein